MRHDILVYNGEGMAIGSLLPSLTDSFNKRAFQIRTITANDIHDGILDRAASRVLILPGIAGEISPYTDQLGNGEMTDIAEFLRRGRNVLLAVCAGAAFISGRTLYTPRNGPVRERAAALPLFNGLAHGPVADYGRAPTARSRFSDVAVVPVRHKDMNGAWRDTGVCYGNGPAFYPDDPHDPEIDVLAVYAEVSGRPAALLRQRVGRGSAYLSAILPDIAYQHIAPQPGLHNARQLMTALAPHEAGRKALWADLTARIRRDLAPY